LFYLFIFTVSILNSHFFIISIHQAGYVFLGSNNRMSAPKKTVGSIRVRAWFSIHGAREIALLDDDADITDLVDNYLVAKAAALFGIGPLRFVDDSGCALTTSSFECFKKLESKINIKEIKWPYNSSHLSPFFTVWHRIDKTIRIQRFQPEDPVELWNLIEMVWGRMSDRPVYWRGAIFNMQSKLRVIAALRGERMEGEMMANYYNQVPY
jgi:hypothetical protein